MSGIRYQNRKKYRFLLGSVCLLHAAKSLDVITVNSTVLLLPALLGRVVASSNGILNKRGYYARPLLSPCLIFFSQLLQLSFRCWSPTVNNFLFKKNFRLNKLPVKPSIRYSVYAHMRSRHKI